MKQFSNLYQTIDQSTKTNDKVLALIDYFKSDINEKDKLWTLAFFTHRRPSRPVNTTLLREWCCEYTGLPSWLLEDTYHIVGDLAETLALVLPKAEGFINIELHALVEQIIKMKSKPMDEKKAEIFYYWSVLSTNECYLFMKIITGGFRVGVSQNLMIKALAKVYNVEDSVMAYRIMGNWTPATTTWYDLIVNSNTSEDQSKPYPFYLAYSLDVDFEQLGTPQGWTAEYKWDGIRGQLIKRKGEIYLWSRGEELITEKFPEFQVLSNLANSDFVIDGEILVGDAEGVQNFNALQTRIGRKSVTKAILKNAPAIIIAYDILELNGVDIRNKSYLERREALEKLIQDLNLDNVIRISPRVHAGEWQHFGRMREEARTKGAEGIMLKKNESPYLNGRKRGDWWKWKIDPFTIDAVMLYAQRGHGRRSNLFSDFTFAVWDDDGRLVPIAKAYSGLTDDEFNEITSFVKKNTIEKFGPVTSVNPILVFELAFEGIALSPRHKSGIAVRFPRIKRWRKDKKAEDANTLTEMKALLAALN